MTVIQQILIDSLIGKRDFERNRTVCDMAVETKKLCLCKHGSYNNLQ